MSHYNSRLFAIREMWKRNPPEGEREIIVELKRRNISYQHQRPLLGRYFADFFFKAEKLVVEVDGPEHDVKADAVRDHNLKEAGFGIARVLKGHAMHDTRAVVDEIEELLKKRLVMLATRPLVSSVPGFVLHPKL